MASYIELTNLFNDDELRFKLDFATIVAATNLITGASPTIDQQKWAVSVLANPRNESKKVYMAVLAINKDLTVSQIRSASTTDIQTRVDSVVPALIVAFNAV
jgi:hypothetical protein